MATLADVTAAIRVAITTVPQIATVLAKPAAQLPGPYPLGLVLASSGDAKLISHDTGDGTPGASLFATVTARVYTPLKNWDLDYQNLEATVDPVILSIMSSFVTGRLKGTTTVLGRVGQTSDNTFIRWSLGPSTWGSNTFLVLGFDIDVSITEGVA
jgi:hypothetical protein